MFYAAMDTKHFTFRAIGLTYTEAVEALRTGIQRYCDKTGAQLMAFTGSGFDNGDINVLEMKPNSAYCDYCEI